MEANHGVQIVGIYLVNNRNISGRLPSLDACVACQSKNLMADEVPVVTIGTIVTTFFSLSADGDYSNRYDLLNDIVFNY